MATLFTIDYEAGSNGAAVGAESTWDTVTGTATYQTSAAVNGSLGIQTDSASTLRKNVSATANVRMRWFFSLPVIAPGTNATMAIARSSTTARCQIRLESAGTLRLINASTATGSSSASLTAAELVRCEWEINGGAGTQALELYRGANAHGTTPDETLSGTFTNATFDNIGVAFFITVSGFLVNYDEVVCTDTPTTQIGGFPPAAVTPRPPVVAPSMAAHQSATW